MTASLVLLLLCGCAASDPVDLAVSWTLDTNFVEGGGHRARFAIRNDSSFELNSSNWEMYWNMAPRAVDPESITGPVTIEWINGDFFVMKPTHGFRLLPGETIEVAYTASSAMIKETDAPSGLYALRYEDDGSTQPHPVRDSSIGPFERPEQIHRGTADLEPIPTPEWLYDQYASITELDAEQLPPLLPTPRSWTIGEGHFDLSATTGLTFESGLESEAALLAKFLGRVLDGPVAPTGSGSPVDGNVHLQFREVEVQGSYELRVSEDEGVVIAGDRSGVFYGSQSLKALIPAERLGRKSESLRLPAVRLADAPAFAYRGVHLDVARNFHSVDTVKRLLDVIAFYKLNKLHLHLTEDEGWRVEIEGLPELTQVGAFRGHTSDNAEHLQPAYGSGPFPDATAGYGSGFYTRGDYIDLVRYAGARHIEIIPEINVPGHSRAAIKSMEHRYRRLMADGQPVEAERYRLVDPDDASDYRSAQWYTDNVISVCRESAYEFLTMVIDDLIEMHAKAGFPLRTLHTGGDEVPTGAWSESPMCVDYLAEHPEIDNPRNLQKAYFRRARAYLESNGLDTAGWEEIAMDFREDGSWTPSEEFAGSNVIPYVWHSLWGSEDLAYRLANSGYPVVLSNVTNFYFDLAYNKDPREPGLYWGGFVDTRDAFEFLPYNLFGSIKTDPLGRRYTDQDFVGKEELTNDGRSNILGLQGQLWSETIKGQEMLEYYYLPKVLGLAERAWVGEPHWGSITDREERNRAADTAWNAFAHTIGQRELPRLERLDDGYGYRLAPPGAKLKDGRLLVNTAYPGMTVRYTTDGSRPTAESALYTEPLPVGSRVITLGTFDSRGRSSLPTVVDLRED